MLTQDFDYDLPKELIAQEPPAQRGQSRMLVLRRDTGRLADLQVSNLPDFLTEKDLVVVNNTRVFPARLAGEWIDSGGWVELLLVQPASLLAAPEAHLSGGDLYQADWLCLGGSGRRIREGLRARFADGLIEAEIIERKELGGCVVRFNSKAPLLSLLEMHGQTPLPPYIHRDEGATQTPLDRERYQTIYAQEVGAVAAPTAGLHFNESIFDTLKQKGVQVAALTLHVGPGTFRPVKTTTVEEHIMDPERYVIPQATAEAINKCRREGGRVLAVGSTSVRTLESVALNNRGQVVATSGTSSLFIYPPFDFKVSDMILTNFHLPQSTLLMMMSAFAGRERILQAYRHAVEHKYRFFSYGDCMLIV